MENKIPLITSPHTQAFWDAAADGRLVVQKCTDCGRLIFYPRPLCINCFSDQLEWQEVSGKGEVHTFSVIHAAPLVGFEEEMPYILAVVQLEEGPFMMANIRNCDPDNVRVGLKVNVIFEERDGRAIPQFVPI